MSHILAIDPGLRATGYAYFRHGTLAQCGIKGSRARERAEAAAVIGRELAVEFRRPLDALIVEVPQVYQARLLKGDPNDLVSVALVAGATLQLPALIRLAVSPHQWKGNVPKEVTRSRVLFGISPAERLLISESGVAPSLQHNIYDAVGIGLWYLRRHAAAK